MSKTEYAVWTGHPSQWINLPIFLFWGAVALAGIALSFALTAALAVLPVCAGFVLWEYLVVKNQGDCQ